MVRKISKKKYKQHFYGNKKKISINFLYNFLIFAIVCLGVFLIISIYFSAVDYVKRTNVIKEQKEMQFMFIDNQGIQHNINQESNEHGASSKRDYLFKDYSTGDTINTGILNTGSVNTGNVAVNDVEDIDIEIENNEKTISKIDIKNNIIKEDSNIIKKSCISPRRKIVKHGESVLAYQQREDVPDVCNIQRRKCEDGILVGSFEQKSCKTDIPYNYTRGEVVLYNEKKIDPLVQPNEDLPVNKGAEFDNDGKINIYTHPDTVRDNNIDDSIKSASQTIDQTEMIIPNCISPRGGIVLNGQFVKAYRYKNGFTNHPCEVELRPCMQGNLEGIYKNASCKGRDISFEDFLDGYFDNEKPSMQRIIETLNKDIPENEIIIEKPSIWNIISNLWN